MQEKIGIKRFDLAVNEMVSITNVKKSPVIRLTRTGKGSTSGNRDELPTKQMKLVDEFYQELHKITHY